MPLYLTIWNLIFQKVIAKLSGKILLFRKKGITIQSSFKNLISSLSKDNKIILIYPIPEIGVNISRKLLNDHLGNKFKFKKK